jgi:hypothetical protein
MTMVEVASYICQQLQNSGIKTTLSGGFCVEIYSFGEYTSMDIDLIDQSLYGHKVIKQKMGELGFIERNGHFQHADISYTVEFPASPLAVGNEIIKDIAEIETEYGVLRLITPTDCVKDRLSAFYHWDDERSLEQAILVALKNDIDIENIRKWSIKEEAEKKYLDFLGLLHNRKQHR